MKFSESDNSSTLFCEQVSTVTSLFEKWNDCERTVVMYALLKRLRYPSLKFLQYSIESNLKQNLISQISLSTLDVNANSPAYLTKLISTYNALPLKNEDIDYNIYGSELMLSQATDGIKNYKRREDVLKDILVMLPLLKPGNDEAKAIYLSLTPIAVEDTVRKIVPTELVQQIFSYLLIHPAISSDDRRSLSHWLKHLEDHIQSSYSIAGQRSFYVLSNTTDSSSKSTSVSSVGSVTSRNTWQAIAPPSAIHKQQQQQQQTQTIVKAISKPSDWNVNMPRISDSLCDDMQVLKLNEIGSSQNSLGLVYDGPTPSVVNGSRNPNNNNTNINNNNANDDHHVSFSKNGTEIIDFDTCDNCDMQINNCDHFNMTRWSLDSKISGIKTRRSNSLTTAISSSSSSTSSVVTVNDNCSNSSENLAQYIQKPRSFSLSIENTRPSLASGGSDTRLDDLKPSYLKFQTHNLGMSNIGQWLKSLRLHKYITLFTNMTYDEMLSITEDYLQSLGVTKGASHKLALCIEKLNERYDLLSQIESDLLTGKITLNYVIEEMANLVLTPMKPTDSTPRNVATKFLEILELIYMAVYQKDNFSVQDEECITVVLWILERSIHNEAFFVHTNQLKEQKFNLSKLKMSFTPKPHNAKNASNGSLNKPRWINKSRKVDAIVKTGSNDRIHRKNSNDTSNNFSLIASIPQHVSNQLQSSMNVHQCTQNYFNNLNAPLVNNGINCQPYKSSSYPNFTTQQQSHNQQAANNHLQQFQQQQHHHTQQQSQLYRHHRNSLNNLIIVSTSSSPQSAQTYKTVNSLLPVQNPNNSTSINTMVNNGLECNNRKSSLTTVTPINTAGGGAGKSCGALLVPNSSGEAEISSTLTPTASSAGPLTTTIVATNATSTNVPAKPLEKTMAAVVLVSKHNLINFEGCSVGLNINNNNNSSTLSTSPSSTSCKPVLSTNYIIPQTAPTQSKDKHTKNNSINDRKSLDQLEFLCLQMTEQAIN